MNPILFPFIICCIFFTSISISAVNESFIDFSSIKTIAYIDQDFKGTVSAGDNGLSLSLKGNRVRAIPFDYVITQNTRLSFEFRGAVQGEIHAIGMDNDLVLGPDRTFQLYGTQQYGVQAFRSYSGAGVVHYDIPVGEHYTGLARYLYFVMDHDKSIPTGESVFSKVRVYEKDNTTFPSVSTVDFSAVNSVPYARQDRNGDIVVGNAGHSFALTGNRVRAIPFEYRVTTKTRLSFEFSSSKQGEVHAIGMDDNLFINRNRTFKLYGTQMYGIQNYNDYNALAGVRKYDIAVGEFYTGSMQYLYFVMDHDVSQPDGESIFNNVRVYESDTPIVFDNVVSDQYAPPEPGESEQENIPPKEVELPPNVEFILPADELVLQEGDNIQVQLNAVDSDGSIAYCDLYLNDALIRRATDSLYYFDGRNPLLRSLSPGRYQLKAICVDQQGLSAVAQQTFTVLAKQSPPQVSFAWPPNGSVLAGDTISISIDAHDSDGIIQYCSLYKGRQIVRQVNVAPYEWGFEYNDLALINIKEGIHGFMAICVDDDGLQTFVRTDISVQALPEKEPVLVGVLLDWVIPAAREDGSLLDVREIDSYEIHYYSSQSTGKEASLRVPAFDQSGVLVSSYIVTGIPSGDYFFAIATVDTQGNVSAFADPITLAVP